MSSDGSPSPVARVQPRSMTWFVGLLVGAVVLAGALGLGASSAYADSTPIQGTWNFQGGEVVIQPQSDGTLIGVDVVATTFLNCTHPVAQVIWHISGSGLTYTGTHLWLHPDCSIYAPGLSTWTVDTTDPTQYVMTFCTAHPGTGPPDPSASPGHPVGATLCYRLTRKLSPSQTQAVPVPVNTAPPTITGTAKVGSTLTCSTGTWTNSPAGYAYQWNGNGTPIATAMTSTYKVATGDERHTLTCTVTAANLGGLGRPATSIGVLIPVLGCPVATGRLHGRTLGLAKLGMTRARVRALYAGSSLRRGKFQDFFCLTPIGVRVGYASPKLLRAFSGPARKHLRRRVIWASTANPFYALRGVRPGATIATAGKHLKLGAAFRIGGNRWYLAPNGGSTAVLKVRRGIVLEIGIADKRFTRSRPGERTLMRSFG